MKRSPTRLITLNDAQISAVVTAVFNLAEKRLDPKYFMLDVILEKEAGAWYLRLFVEGQDFPISLDHCETISRTLDEPIEQIPELKDISYSLEVSSPGLFRPLTKAREFSFFTTRPVRIAEELVFGENELPEEVPVRSRQRRKKTGVTPLRDLATGTLKAFDEQQQLVTIEKKDGTVVQFPVTERVRVFLNPAILIPNEEALAQQSEVSDSTESVLNKDVNPQEELIHD